MMRSLFAVISLCAGFLIQPSMLFAQCPCTPPTNDVSMPGQLSIGVDPGYPGLGTGAQGAKDYWNLTFSTSGLYRHFTEDAYGAADISVTVDPSLGTPAVNVHDSNGRGWIYVRPDVVSNPTYLRNTMRHELGHSVGFANAGTSDGCDTNNSVMVTPALVGPDHTEPGCGDLKGVANRYGGSYGGGGAGSGCKVAENCTPIIIPLSPQAIEFSTPDVLFDFDGSGTKVITSWPRQGVDVGFLGLDRDGDGIIADGRELFGNSTPLSSSLTGGVATNGFDALAWFDQPQNGGNEDGWITSADSIFSRLVIWIDGNHNGIAEKAEVFSLASKRIEAISLRYQEAMKRDAVGNLFRFRSQVLQRTNNGAAVPRFAYDVFLKTVQ